MPKDKPARRSPKTSQRGLSLEAAELLRTTHAQERAADRAALAEQAKRHQAALATVDSRVQTSLAEMQRQLIEEKQRALAELTAGAQVILEEALAGQREDYEKQVTHYSERLEQRAAALNEQREHYEKQLAATADRCIGEYEAQDTALVCAAFKRAARDNPTIQSALEKMTASAPHDICDAYARCILLVAERSGLQAAAALYQLDRSLGAALA